MRSYFIETAGVVTELLPNALFRVQLDNGSHILGDPSRKMRKNYTPILMGDRVEVALTSHASTHGCITHRIPNKKKLAS